MESRGEKNCLILHLLFQGMFIKSNPKAFPLIIKYLFTICDPNEFKKKFCWPIYNKAAEATFRYDHFYYLFIYSLLFSLVRFE